MTRTAAVTALAIGHKGADHIAPGNTIASFEAALAHGVDMIEFDVLPEHADGTGRLVLAHDYRDAHRARATILELEEGLAHLATDAFAGVELDVDLKLARLRGARLRRRCASTGWSSARWSPTMVRDEPARACAPPRPRLRLGWSVPHVRRDYTRRPAHAAAGARGSAARPPGDPARRAAARAARGPHRRRDGPLGARDAPASRAGSPPRAASSTCGRSTTPSASRRSRRCRA